MGAIDGTTMAAQKTACNNLVNGDNQTNCLNAQPTYCGGVSAYTDCPDINLDGTPDNQLKTQGVIGAIRCLVGSAYFGAGNFIEIPFRDGGGGILDRGNQDEVSFRHFLDMTGNINRVREVIGSFNTNGNYDFPEASMLALYSVLSGKGQTYGHLSMSIPERALKGCPANTFGYPCFRNDTIPVVVLFTDDPMNNGPTDAMGVD